MRHHLMDRLSQFCHPKRRVYLHFRLHDMTETRCVKIRGKSLSRPYQGWNRIHFQAQWVCANGVMESSELFSRSLVLSQEIDLPGWDYPVGGRVYPRTYPPAGSMGNTEVENLGNEVAWPLFRLYGGVTNPIITDLTNDRQYIFNGLTIPDGAFLEINTADNLVLMNGDIEQSHYDKLFIPTGTWWGVPPGINSFNYTADTSSGEPRAEIVYRYAYL
jgi:hypothetical protein